MTEERRDFRIVYCYSSRSGQWWWRLVSVYNGQIIATPHERYEDLAHTRYMAERIFTSETVKFPPDGAFLTVT